MEVFSDESLGNVTWGKLQIWSVIGMMDEQDGRCLLVWKSKKGKKGAMPTIEPEVISLGEEL